MIRISKSKLLESLCLIAGSIILTLLVLEVATRLMFGNPLAKNNTGNRITLFQSGMNIKNSGPIFRYAPNSKIRTETYYVFGDRVIKEFGYYIYTNNLGLVQKKDTLKNKKSHLILGNSFTEGQGAAPWFYDLESDNPAPEYQLINGGIMGTGIRQWQLLEQTLVNKLGISIDRTTLVFITNDFRRNVWNFSPEAIACLHNAICSDSNGGYFGFNFLTHGENGVIAAVKKFDRLRSGFDFVNHFKRSFKNLLKMSALFVHFYTFFQNRLNSMEFGSVLEANKKALNDLVKRYSSRINFVHINTKMEAQFGDWNAESQELIEHLSSKYATKNYKKCWLRPEHFHTYDGHPNQMGYARIKACVRDSMTKSN